MALQGAQQAVAGGATQATIGGTFPATYQVGISPGWVTGWRVTAKAVGGFTVDFATPAPAGGATFDWVAGTAIPADSSATAAVIAAAVTVTIAGTFGSTYQVSLGPAWMTAVNRITKTA